MSTMAQAIAHRNITPATGIMDFDEDVKPPLQRSHHTASGYRWISRQLCGIEDQHLNKEFGLKGEPALVPALEDIAEVYVAVEGTAVTSALTVRPTSARSLPRA